MSNEKGFFRRIFSGIGKILAVFRALIKALITILLAIYVVGIIVAIVEKNEIYNVPDAGALRIEISGRIVDQATYQNPFSAFSGQNQSQEYVLRDLIEAIDMATTDSRINSMVLVLHDMEPSSTSKIEELGAAINRFRKTGKRVIAAADSYGQQQYMLASFADEILLHPLGMVELTGLSSYQLYMAEAIDKLGINVHVFRTGPHKNAVEPLIASEMSTESREQSQRILDDLWATIRENMLERRDISEGNLDAYTNQLDQLMLGNGGDLSKLALDFNMVDQVVTRDQLMDTLQSTAGKNEAGDFYEHIDALAYLRSQTLLPEEESKNHVGLIVAKGQIFDGIQESGSIGGDSTAYILKQARLNNDLDALVIRVDSPGGSAFASEIIRREVELFREEGIPVFVSMGSVAASGGYWISAPANEIWATPTTITGSIGAFAALATFEDSLDKLGLNSDGVSTGPLAASMTLNRPLSAQAKTIIQSRSDNLYGQFLHLVSEGREMPLSDVEPIAGGRVWTGKQALELGLVDQLGSLKDVIDAAATKADISGDYNVQLLELPLSREEMLFKWLADNLGVRIQADNWLGKLTAPVSQQAAEIGKQFVLLSDPENMYLHCGLCSMITAH